MLIRFLTKASSKNAKREEIWKQLGCYCFLFGKKIVKSFVQCHVFAHSLPDKHPKDKCPVLYIYIHDIETLVGQKI
jgi:hypothetical protein